MFSWEKKGLLFKPEGQCGIINSYAQVPTLLVKEKVVRVYFSYRPEKGFSLTTYLDLNIDNLSEVLYIHSEPILGVGEPGTFDEHGIMPSSVIEKDGIVYLYYSGWQRSASVPYNNYTGLAVSEDGGNTFKKKFKGPVLDRTPFELFSATSPLVLFIDGKWHCWYSSGTNWHKINDKFEHTYDIKYASSTDGKNWLQPNQIAIKQRNEFEALTRPTILYLDNCYHMWYSYRGSHEFRTSGDSYKIGYATSSDLINWTRKDEESGIELSEEGWDSKMMAYPSVLKIKDKIIMVYNGNDFGAGGFGYAELKGI
jgi:sucrose-6-phosphate hydrolase SacC (GH32 family)